MKPADTAVARERLCKHALARQQESEAVVRQSPLVEASESRSPHCKLMRSNAECDVRQPPARKT
jgi:hypothetical protein